MLEQFDNAELVKKFVAENQLTEQEFVAFYELGLTSHQTRSFFEERMCRIEKLTQHEISHVVDSLIDQELIMIVTPEILKEIQEFVKSKEWLGPCCGYPICNDMDLTQTGANLYLRLYTEVFQHNSHCACRLDGTLPKECSILGTTEEWVQSFGRDCEYTPTSEITAIGPWCTRWWEHYPSGFKQDFKVR